MKPKASFGKMVQVYAGDIHRYHLRKDGRNVSFSICCDCSLVHLNEYTPRKGYIKVRVWRDNVRTKELRARKKAGKR